MTAAPLPHIASSSMTPHALHGVVGVQQQEQEAGSAVPFDVTQDRDKVLPLPGWLVKVYFIFPIVLYMPDVIFNYYVYSHGITTQETNIVVQIAFIGLWAFLSVGVVGMAYLLSVLAPWHWGQGHHIQAFFCGLGVLIATGITTWNSLAYRSQEQSTFAVFKTDDWANSIWPQLAASHVSLTLILVAVAPPFWGLFWAMVQPTQSGRSLRQIQESHAQRLLPLQQQSELKRLRAETNAKIRDAQLRGMAQTAAAAPEQAKQVFGRGDDGTTETGHSEVGSRSVKRARDRERGDREAGTSPAPAAAALPTVSSISSPRPAARSTLSPATTLSPRAAHGARSVRALEGHAPTPAAMPAPDLSHIRLPGDNLPSMPAGGGKPFTING